MKKNEMIIITAVLIIALSVILYMNFADNSGEKYVLITQDGEEIAKYELTQETDIVYEYTDEECDHHNMVIIKNGVAYVEWANCPNQICVNTKEAENIGDTIVCLPHKLVIEIVGE